MGYELNKLMKQYGVSTPGMVAYSGPAAPMVPTAPAKLGAEPSDEETAAYNAAKKSFEDYQKDPAAFNDMMRKYGLAQKEYDAYRQQYQNRMMNTPMYTDAQFNVGLPGAPVAPNYATPVAAPTYGNVPASLTGKPIDQLTAYYDRLRDIGYTDADVRAAAEKTFGKLTDTAWSPYTSRPGSPYYVGPVQPTMPPPAPSIGPMQMQQPVEPQPIVLQPETSHYDYTGYSHGGMHEMAQKYGMGGEVRKFQVGGSEGEAEDPIEAVIRQRSPSMGGEPPVMVASAPAAAQPVAPVTASPAARPVTPPPAASTPVSPAATDLMGMLGKYLSAESTYGPELAAARQRVSEENKAFQKLLENAMKPGENAPDKSEMYFRLAAAFGSPSKTGQFTENLAMAGKEMGEYAKDVRAAKRADQQLRMQLALKGQELKSQAARDELTTLRGLAGEEMKDKRAIVLEYIKSGRPQSEAGKAAVDAGLTQGTPEFTEFVNKYIDDKVRSGNMLKEAMVAIAAGGLQVRQAAEKRQQESAGKLSPKELDLKSKAEDSLLTIDNAMKDLGRAYDLNKNSFDTTLKDRATLTILEQTGSKDPKVLNTKELLNLLKSAMISSASQKLTGVLSDSDIKLLQSVAGIDAKSKEERAQILKNAYRALQTGRTAQQKRLNEISQGLYRETTPAPSGDLD